MRRAFAAGVTGLLLLELANVYFIMPMPGSQRVPSVDAAFWIHGWRWPLRALCVALIVAGARHAWATSGRRRWFVPASLLLVAGVAYVTNFRMSADHLFRQPNPLRMVSVSRSTVSLDRLVVGVAINDDARAYPLQFIGYHHQVVDTVGGVPLLVSYCTVCRTGRVFSPLVEGRAEVFRLVGMDHFNAMLEDRSTGSWWRQANGEAITGRRRGTRLRELPRVQVTLREWLATHPRTLVMQADTSFADEYAKDYAFERGTSRKRLTGTDTASWHEKSWVVGVTVNRQSKAYDWNRLRRERVINDVVAGVPIVIALGGDSSSFFAFERPDSATRFAWRGDSLVSPAHSYSTSGAGQGASLAAVNASQEFWHSWREFQPGTLRY